MMKTILFFTYPYPGPFNATIRLANLLRKAGYRVVYVIAQDITGLARREGYEDVELYEDLFPQWIPSLWSVLALWRNRRKHLGIIRAKEGKIRAFVGKLLARYQPVFAIVDVDVIEYCHALAAAGRPFCLLSTTVLMDKDSNVPPFFSSFVPRPGWVSSRRVALIWQRLTMDRKLFNFFHGLLLEGFTDQKVLLLGRKATRCRPGPGRLPAYLQKVPEMLLYPPEFDYPRPPCAKRLYLGPMVEMQRREPPFDWTAFGDDKPLIYCSFGTVVRYSLPNFGQVLEKFLAAFEALPEYTVILSLGHAGEQLPVRTYPANVHVFDYVPQLQVLERCALMITHGGFNSLKEAILHGVPLLAYPVSRFNDQKGMAARIVYHGIGLRGDLTGDSPGEIRGKCLRLLREASFRQQVRAMGAIFKQYQDREPTVTQLLALP